MQVHLKTAYVQGAVTAIERFGFVFKSARDRSAFVKAAAQQKSALDILRAARTFTQGLGPVKGPQFLDKHMLRLQGIPQDFRAEAPVVKEMPISKPLASPGPSSKVIVDPSLYSSS